MKYIDRMEFLDSINYDNREEMMRLFFDQLMAFYTLVGGIHSNITIIRNADLDYLELFVQFDSKFDAEYIIDRVNHIPKIEMYGSEYVVKMTNVEETSFHIELH